MENRHKKVLKVTSLWENETYHFIPFIPFYTMSYHLFKRLIKQWYGYEATGILICCLRSVKPKRSIQKCKPAQRTENIGLQNIVTCS